MYVRIDRIVLYSLDFTCSLPHGRFKNKSRLKSYVCVVVLVHTFLFVVLSIFMGHLKIRFHSF